MDQFNLAMFIIKNDIKLYNQIPNLNNIPVIFEVQKNPFYYTLLHFFKNWIVGFTCSSLYPGVVEFAKSNPLTYKRVKKDFKKLCSNRDSYHTLKGFYLKQQREINAMNKKHYSTCAVKPKNTEIVVWGSNFNSTTGTGRLTNIVKNMIALPPY